jgi:hypothetical protein
MLLEKVGVHYHLAALLHEFSRSFDCRMRGRKQPVGFFAEIVGHGAPQHKAGGSAAASLSRQRPRQLPAMCNNAQIASSFHLI